MRLSTFIVSAVAALGASVAVAQDAAPGTSGLFDFNPHMNWSHTETFPPEVAPHLNPTRPSSAESVPEIDPHLNLTEREMPAPEIDVHLNRTPPAHRSVESP